MSSINITGEKKPYSGSFYEYQVKLSEPATKDTVFNVLTFSFNAYIEFADHSWKTSGQFTCPAKKDSFKFRVQWMKEDPSAKLMVQEKTGTIAESHLQVNVVCNACTLTTKPADIKMGDDVLCQVAFGGID